MMRISFKNSHFPIFVLTMILIALLLTSCGSPATTEPANTEPTTTQSSQTFTMDELAAYDGQDGRKAYIAVDGLVYDVTALAEWGSKLHAGEFTAGKNYTEEIKAAPHGIDKLLKAVQVGVLAE